MYSKISFQKVIIIIISIVLILSVLLGVGARISYSKESLNKNNMSKAKVTFEEDMLYQFDSMCSSVDYDSALAELDQSNYIFYAECMEREICYGCVKYTLQVFQTLKGDVKETGKEIILYQLIKFDFINDDIYFISPDYSMPLQEGKTYLLFADRRDYDDTYQNTLQTNEYSLALTSSFPTALVVDETQKQYIQSSDVTQFADIDSLNYICFSEAALTNINEISAQLIKHYLGI